MLKKFILPISIFVFAFLFVSATPVSAKILTNEQGTVVVGRNEIIDDDLFIGAQSAQIDGVVNGDVFIGAQNVVINGNVNGNLHVGSRSVNISGRVTGNTYIGAENVVLTKSDLRGSLILGAASLSLDKDSVVSGSLIAGVGSASIDSKIKRSAYIGAGSLSIGDDALIGKDLYYGAGDGQGSVNISDKAVVNGSIYKQEVKTNEKEITAAKAEAPKLLSGFKFVGSFISYLGALVIGFIYLRLFGKHAVRVSEIVTKSFWKSLGIGFIVMIATIPGLIIMALTVVGLPVAGITILVLLLFVYFSKIVVAGPVGKFIAAKFNWKWSMMGIFALGLFAFYLVKMIPVVGPLASLAVLWAGVGALAIDLFSSKS